MLMQGWLRIRRLWKARKRANEKFVCKWQWPLMWHVLRPGLVELYQSADESELLMQFQLCATSELVPFSAMTPRRASAEGLSPRRVAAEGLQEVNLGFCITDASSRCRYFHADNEEMLEKWIQAFQVALSLFVGHPSAAPLSKPDTTSACNNPGDAANGKATLSESMDAVSNESQSPKKKNIVRKRDLQRGPNSELQAIAISEEPPPDLSVATTSSDGLVFTFRFVNYNMANHDLNLDRLGNGFADKRYHMDKELGSRPDTDEGDGDTARSVPFDELIAQGVSASLEDDACEVRMTSPVKKKLERGESRGLFRSKTNDKVSPDGRGHSDNVSPKASPRASPIPAGSTPDCVFGTFCETKLDLARYDGHLLTCGLRICHTHAQSARQILTESGMSERLKAAVADKLNGDIRTVHVCSSKLVEVESGKVFCSFDETGGMSKSNPMKCFMGRSFDAVNGGVRFIALGSHFPMQELTRSLLDETLSDEELMLKLKGMVASRLKKILNHVLSQGLLTACTVLILQGDLNSRTVITRDSQNKCRFADLLSETLRDTSWQKVIADEVPEHLQGVWQEAVDFPDPGQLPVTYRFETQAQAADTKFFDLTLSHVYGDMRSDSAVSEAATMNMPRVASYRAVLDQLGSKVDEWGLYRPKGDSVESKFKPGRLPACTERVLYYTPAAFKQKCHWQSSRGYEVNYKQQGSDHKPVILEAEVYIGEKMPSNLRRASASVDEKTILFRPRKRIETDEPPSPVLKKGPTFFGGGWTRGTNDR